MPGPIPLQRIIFITAAWLMFVGCGPQDDGDSEKSCLRTRTCLVSEDSNPSSEVISIENQRDTRSVVDDDNELPPLGEVSFFITSEGSGELGGNLGGLAQADARCQRLAAASLNLGHRVWRAYLSTSDPAGQTTVHARDRIGSGPWFDIHGIRIANDIEDLHTNGLSPDNMYSDRGEHLADPAGSQYRVLTGSDDDGRAIPGRTCDNWTSDSAFAGVQVGQTRSLHGSWNSERRSSGCDRYSMAINHTHGRFYCFALSPE